MASIAQLSASRDQVAKSSNEQNQAATSMASTIEELTVSIDRLSEKAEEVRGLAARTSSSAQEITSTIGQIERGTRKSVDTMTAGVHQVNHGADLSSQAGRAIEDIQ